MLLIVEVPQNTLGIVKFPEQVYMLLPLMDNGLWQEPQLFTLRKQFLFSVSEFSMGELVRQH